MLFQNLKVFSCQGGQFLKSGTLGHNDVTSRAVMCFAKLTEEHALRQLDSYARVALPCMFGLMSQVYLGDNQEKPFLSGVNMALKKDIFATGADGELTLHHVTRLILPDSLDGYLTCLGAGWKKEFLTALATMPEVISNSPSCENLQSHRQTRKKVRRKKKSTTLTLAL